MKTFNCPFCKVKLNKFKLEKHIEKEHDDELPVEYTPYRMVYDIINDKHGHGTCTECGKDTKWNEKRQKYNRLCGDPKCYEAVKKTYQSRMMKVYNKINLADDPHHQEKMLAGRKISGSYTWSDGKKFTFTGQYEKKFLEFLDKVMEYKSDEVIAPGPILEYNFKGQKHHWITDVMILPYNLIVEIKDGGDNPNNRFMPEYRAKQFYKEKMITNLGTYHYLRLTNNDFSQFLSIIAELKMQVVEDNNKPMYRIHEDLDENNDNFDMIMEAAKYAGPVDLETSNIIECINYNELPVHFEVLQSLHENLYTLGIIYPNPDIIAEEFTNVITQIYHGRYRIAGGYLNKDNVLEGFLVGIPIPD